MSKYETQAALAREHFPRGLFQPEKSFRFSLDALLLAAYAARLRPDWLRLADLGCGCGPVALGALILSGAKPGREALGLDRQPELLAAAKKNAALLGFEAVCSVEQADFANYEPGAARDSFDLVTANPPYRLPDEGRLPPSPLRRAALFGGRENLAAFVRAGRVLLAPEGLFCLIFPAGRADELTSLLAVEGLALQAACPVFSREASEPSLVLLAAQKYGERNKLAWREQKPLRLYCSLPSGGTILSGEALDFCPFLSCNMEG